MAGERFLQPDLVNGRVDAVVAVQAGGAGSENKIPALDSAGRLALTMMPVGVGAAVKDVVTSEALAAGDIVNLHVSTGLKARKADATTEKEGVGFVLSAYDSAATATVYFEGIITGLTGLTAGSRYFLAKTAGAVTTDVSAYAAGNILQYLGIAISTTELKFEPGEPITLG